MLEGNYLFWFFKKQNLLTWSGGVNHVQVILGEKPTPPQQPQFRCGVKREDGKQD